jgi:hypothetical protein
LDTLIAHRPFAGLGIMLRFSTRFNPDIIRTAYAPIGRDGRILSPDTTSIPRPFLTLLRRRGGSVERHYEAICKFSTRFNPDIIKTAYAPMQVKALGTGISHLLCSFVMRSMLCPSPKLKTLLAKHYTKRAAQIAAA